MTWQTSSPAPGRDDAPPEFPGSTRVVFPGASPGFTDFSRLPLARIFVQDGADSVDGVGNGNEGLQMASKLSRADRFDAARDAGRQTSGSGGVRTEGH
jgi:hypothetical protein